MSILRTIGLTLSICLVVSLAAIGLVFANDRALSIQAEEAALVADTYNVGTAFGGTVQEMYVERGSVVTAGQDLLRLQSATLEQALATSRFNAQGVGYRVEEESVFVFTAVEDGVVQELNANTGSFVPANQVIAVVGIADSLHLESSFIMNARDYARLPVGGVVGIEMPDGAQVDATIYDIQVDSSDGTQAETIVRARSEEIRLSGSILAGAPVTASLRLDDDEGLGNWVARQFAKLLEPNGFSS